MIDSIEFTIFISPIPKGRPIFSNGHVRTPQQTVLFESAFRAMSRKYRPISPLNEPLDVLIEFHFIRPKTSKRKLHCVRPDIDNLVKSVLDACNTIFFKDDGQICKLTAHKFYSEKEYIRVVINEYTEETR